MTKFYSVLYRKPIGIFLIFFGIMIVGMISFVQLNRATLPEFDVPVIILRANLNGASSEVVAQTLSAPLETYLGSISGVSQISSQSGLGSSMISMVFDSAKDIDVAAREVQGALNAVRSQLPSAMTELPLYKKINPSLIPVIKIGLTSDQMSYAQLYTWADTVLSRQILKFEGVGDVTISGAAPPAIRIILNPYKMFLYGLSANDIQQALLDQFTLVPKGFVQTRDATYTLRLRDGGFDKSDYTNVIIAYRDNRPVWLSDVATVTESTEDTQRIGIVNGKNGVVLTVHKSQNSNVNALIQSIKDALPQYKTWLAKKAEITLIGDRSITVGNALYEALKTFCFALVIVIGVVWLFLEGAGPIVIAVCLLPFPILAIFPIMYFMDYSLNLLTMVALIISIGLIIDDMIIVIENMQRYCDQGFTPQEAMVRNGKDLTFTLLSISLSLIVLFGGILFVSAMVKRIFLEFVLTLSMVVMFSYVLSVTAVPVYCAWLLKPVEHKRRPRLKHILLRQIEDLKRAYCLSLVWILRRFWIILVLFFAINAGNVYLALKLGKTFFPNQDLGMIRGHIILDAAQSFQSLQPKLQEVKRILNSDQRIAEYAIFSAEKNTNYTINIDLVPMGQRPTVYDVVSDLSNKMKAIVGVNVVLSAQQELNAGGSRSNNGAGAQYSYALFSDTFDDLKQASMQLSRAMQKNKVFTEVSSDMEGNLDTEFKLTAVRPLAQKRGVSMQDIDEILYNFFGQRKILTMYELEQRLGIVLSLQDNYEFTPRDLGSLYIKSQTSSGGVNGQGMIPLSSLADVSAQMVPRTIFHKNGQITSEVSFNLANGADLSVGVEQIKALMKTLPLPLSVHGEFTDVAKDYEALMQRIPVILLIMTISIYLILGVLYESLLNPIVILSALPSAGFGTISTLYVTHTSFNLMTFLALFLSIGIITKNSIMIVDFTLQSRKAEGLSATEAVLKACDVRFKPILMTTIASIAGAIPMVLAHNPGYELQRPLAIAIIGGLCFSQVFVLYTTPTLYVLIERIKEGFLCWRQR